MLQPIPAQILKHTVTLSVCTAINTYSKPTYGTTQVLKRVCMQPSNETRKTRDNTEVVLRAVCYVDARRSTPKGIDVDALKLLSDAAGGDLRLTFGAQVYTVLSVDSLYDDTGALHHTEIGLGGV